MPANTPRFEDRIHTLDECFNLEVMEQVWRKYVKTGLRDQDVIDLHDYYDFHRNRRAVFAVLRKQILDGQYHPKQPLIIRLEKKYGVCRHLQIPSPEDAVILQTLVETLAPIIQKNEPSKRAYYSRSHKAQPREDSIDETFPYPWFKLWPVFQERIYGFAKRFKYVVVTDIANYFDNISFDRLRNVISSYGKFDETLLDFLFFMLESFVWRPDYLPLSGVGLPQVNFDAPRLLAHSFLFEVDRYLDRETQGNFVRWMDDIDFGVDEPDSAKRILRGLDELLLSRGLRLNMAKTRILSSETAKLYFLPDENRFLTTMTKRINRLIEKGSSIDHERKWIRKRFRSFLKQQRTGRWDKVYARYFTIARKTSDPFLEKYVPELLEDSPGLRDSVFKYYSDLGFNRKRFEHLRVFFEESRCVDDASVFAAAQVLTGWRVFPGSRIRKQIIDMAMSLPEKMEVCSDAHLAARIWLLAKYASATQLATFLGNVPSGGSIHSSFRDKSPPRYRKYENIRHTFAS